MNIKKILWWYSGDSYGVYVTAYLARLTALGYTAPSASTLQAMSTFINSLGTIPTKLDTLYIFALNDPSLQNAASVNLISPTLFQCTYVNSPAYAAKGVRPNGSTSYVDTNFNAADGGTYKYVQDSACRFYYVETALTSGIVGDGKVTTAGPNRTVISAAANTSRINQGVTNLVGGNIDLTGTGYVALNRSDSTNVQSYKETTKSDRTSTSAAMTSENQAIGKSGSAFGNPEVGIYGNGQSLTEVEHNLIRSSYLTYRTAIGL